MKRQAEAAMKIQAMEMFVLGGAGPDIGKGFETVHGQVWILNLSTKCWLRAKCSGVGPEQQARFEHTSTLVGDPAQGNATLFVIGGLSQVTANSIPSFVQCQFMSHVYSFRH